MLNTGVLEHTVIVVPLTTDCSITEGGWLSLVSREIGLWPGKPGFNMNKDCPPCPPFTTSRPAVERSQSPIQWVLGVISLK